MDETKCVLWFVEANRNDFKIRDGVTLKQVFSQYIEYCGGNQTRYRRPLYTFREELKSYFAEFHDRVVIDGVCFRNYYSGFKHES